jgi:lipoprotein-anchoring transpeptidase ErfK/SrfK
VLHCSLQIECIEGAMTSRIAAVVLVGATVALGGCVQTFTQYEPASTKGQTERDKKHLSSGVYAQATIREPYRRAIVKWHRKELAGTIVVDTDARYLYYVLPEGKAIRYGVTVGEDALAWSGVARVGRLAEWPDWVPTADIKQRIGGLPDRVPGGPKNPLGARGIYLYEGNKDTLFRIHGTNQPELIGEAISSGCIRMTNEDVIDLYERVKMGSPVVVLGPKNGDSPFNPRTAALPMRT